MVLNDSNVSISKQHFLFFSLSFCSSRPQHICRQVPNISNQKLFWYPVGKSASTTPTHCHKAVVLVCYHGDEHAERRLLFGSDARLGRETANAEVE